MSDLRKAAEGAFATLALFSVGEKPSDSTVIDVIANLLAALAQPEPAGAEDMKVYAAIAEGYGRLEKRLGCVQHDCDVCRAALAQPEQEPVAWIRQRDNTLAVNDGGLFGSDWTPLYTTPPQRTWVGLTDQEIAQGSKELWVAQQAFESAVWWAEAKLKEKNGG